VTVYVWRDGKLVEKNGKSPVAPYRFREYESPIDGALITSSRQRERDLERSGSIDPRDLPEDQRWLRGRDAQRQEADAGSTGQQQLDFWR
jgi:hypothetical protein